MKSTVFLVMIVQKGLNNSQIFLRPVDSGQQINAKNLPFINFWAEIFFHPNVIEESISDLTLFERGNDITAEINLKNRNYIWAEIFSLFGKYIRAAKKLQDQTSVAVMAFRKG